MKTPMKTPKGGSFPLLRIIFLLLLLLFVLFPSSARAPTIARGGRAPQSRLRHRFARPVEDGEGIEVAPGLAGAEVRGGAAEILKDTVGWVALDGEDERIEGARDDP